MDQNSTNSGAQISDTDSIVLPKSKPDTFAVLNLLPESRIAWLRQQSVRVAEVFGRRDSPPAE